MQSNIRKIFIYILTGRRNFWPLVPIFYLTLPGSSLAHLGIFSAISMGIGLLTEIPTGYLADRLGHKKTLVLGKISMLVSTIFLLLGASFMHFALYYTFFALALALRSGTLQAFSQEVFEELGKGDKYGMVMGKLRGNVSLISMVLIIVYPLLFSLSPYWAFGVALCIDIAGLIFALLLASPKKTKTVAKDVRSMVSLIGEFFSAKNFLIVAAVAGMMRVIFFSFGPFKEPFLIEMGYPVALIGCVMGLSRFFRFVFGRAVGALKQVPPLHTLILVDGTVMAVGRALIGYVTMPWYLAGFLMSVLVGFYYGRGSLYTHYLLQYIPNKQYKATFLSIKGLLESLVGVALPMGVAAVMAVGYKQGFLLVACLFAVVASIGYILVKK